MSEKIEVTHHGYIAVVTINDPSTMNSVTDLTVLEDLINTFERLHHNDDVRVCVLTGVGRAFCSGGNVKDMLHEEKMFAGQPLELQERYRTGIHRLSTLLYRYEKPLIAAVNGAAVGAGLDLAMLCDVRLASEKARFGSTFINLAIIPGDGGAWLLTKVVGAQYAAEMVLTGRIIDADEALSKGLVLKVLPQEKLLDEAMDLAKIMASKSPQAIKIAKRLLNSVDRVSFADHLNLCSANQAMLHRADDHKDALEAFLSKKK